MRLNNDRNVWWRPGRIFIPAQCFDFLPGVRGTGAAVTADMQFNATGGPGPDATEVVVADAAGIYRLPMYSAGTGNPELVRLGVVSGPLAVLMTAAGDDVRGWFRPPADLDPQYPTWWRVHWTSAAAAVGARDITWKVFLSSLAENATITAPTANLTLAVDVPTGTPHQWQMTSEGLWGPQSAGAFSDNTEAFGVIVEMDAFNAALSENKYFLGVEIRYTPRRFYYGDGMGVEAKAPLATLARNY